MANCKTMGVFHKLLLPLLVGTSNLWTLWSPLVSLNQERHTQSRKAANFIFILLFFCDKNPLKSPPWKHTWWSEHFGKFPKKKLNRHISRRGEKTGFQIAEICGGFGHIPSFLLLKHVYEGRANPNLLTPKEDNRTDKHLFFFLKLSHFEEEKNRFWNRRDLWRIWADSKLSSFETCLWRAY